MTTLRAFEAFNFNGIVPVFHGILTGIHAIGFNDGSDAIIQTRHIHAITINRSKNNSTKQTNKQKTIQPRKEKETVRPLPRDTND